MAGTPFTYTNWPSFYYRIKEIKVVPNSSVPRCDCTPDLHSKPPGEPTNFTIVADTGVLLWQPEHSELVVTTSEAVQFYSATSMLWRHECQNFAVVNHDCTIASVRSKISARAREAMQMIGEDQLYNTDMDHSIDDWHPLTFDRRQSSRPPNFKTSIWSLGHGCAERAINVDDQPSNQWVRRILPSVYIHQVEKGQQDFGRELHLCGRLGLVLGAIAFKSGDTSDQAITQCFHPLIGTWVPPTTPSKNEDRGLVITIGYGSRSASREVLERWEDAEPYAMLSRMN